ncbi:MAG: hypothetical protein JSU81_05285 [Candidatus Coatesbacteria bacterium]|nr:MAG: hypothetical protein JSU81_05285 [Candidatus Coatesbacteria bacterium]
MCKIHGLRTFVLGGVLACAASLASADEDLRFHSYPNPFVAGYVEAKVFYDLPARSTISLYVYDLEGNRLRTLVDQVERRVGIHNGQETWDGRDDEGEFVPAGAYLLVLDVQLRGERLQDTFLTVVER